MDNLGAETKKLVKFLSMGKQLANVDPIMSYYTQLFFVTSAMQAKEKGMADMELITKTMTQLEEVKRSSVFPPELSKDEAHLHCLTFAKNVFASADAQDRKGPVGKHTAKAFRSAHGYIEVCKQFGPLSGKFKELSIYAAWKVTDILKALKEGREPKSGGPNEQEDDMDDLALIESWTKMDNKTAEEDDEEEDEEEEEGNANGKGGDVVDTSVKPSEGKHASPEEFTRQTGESALQDDYFGIAPGDVSAPPLPEPSSAFLTPSSSSASASASGAASATTPSYAAPSAYVDAQDNKAKAKPKRQAPKPKKTTASSIILEPTTALDSHSFMTIGADVERLVDHARSAIRFRDFKTTTQKLTEALQMIWAFQDAEEAEDDDDDDSEDY